MQLNVHLILLAFVAAGAVLAQGCGESGPSGPPQSPEKNNTNH